ncbi:hypothetical protein ACLQ3B_04725 [Micromonospora sp. DT53]|uniref:hypothetical protein n=1 Tax=Micromonospora sp. DT53 TaxID=3393444 RepID=UPI003CEB4EDD
MFRGEVVVSDLERALEQSRRAEGLSEPVKQPSIVWAAGDVASYTYPTPWGQVLDFVLMTSSGLLAEGIGANVPYEKVAGLLRKFQTSVRTATPSFCASHDPGKPDKVIATAVVAAIVATPGDRGFAAPAAEELLVLDRAVVWTHRRAFYAYVVTGLGGQSFFADVVVPLEGIRHTGIQTKVHPNI